jgi:hypothetical protein
MSAPHDQAVQDDSGELYFVASFPAFKKLGARFQQIRDSGGSDDGGLEAGQIQEAQGRLIDQAAALERKLLQDKPELHKRLSEQGLLGSLRGSPAEVQGGEIDKLLDEVTAAGVNEMAAKGIPVIPFDEQAMLAECEAISQGLEASERPANLPHGTVCVICGDGKRVSKAQKSLFQWLDKNQSHIVEELTSALREKYQELLPALERQHRAKAGERLFLPAVVKGNESDDLFLIREVHLSPSEQAIGVVIACAFNDDDPMGVLIDDGEVADIGPVDVAYVATE